MEREKFLHAILVIQISNIKTVSVFILLVFEQVTKNKQLLHLVVKINMCICQHRVLFFHQDKDVVLESSQASVAIKFLSVFPKEDMCTLEEKHRFRV